MIELPDKRIVVVGSANIDLVTRVPRSPKPGESLIGHSFATVCGGKGSNQAVAAARLGAETAFAGCVGRDVFGEMQRDSLAGAGVDVSAMLVHAKEPTGTAVILVAEAGQNCIVVTPSANFAYLPEQVEKLEAMIAGADALLVQLEIPLESVETALSLAARHGVFSVLDAGPARQIPDALVRLPSILSPNETEAEALTGVRVDGIDSARSAAHKLLQRGARAVVMKLGGLGSLYVSAGKELHEPPFQVDVVDTTAAGDAFTAALTLAWEEECEAGPSLRFANAAGALACTKAGAQPSMPTREAVEALLAGQPETME